MRFCPPIRHCATALVLLGILAASALAQQAQPPQPGRAAALAALAELSSLRTAQTLQMDRAKAASVLAAVDELATARSDFATWASGQWQAQGAQVSAALRAWTPGAAADQATLALYREYQAQLRTYREALGKAVTALDTALDPKGGLIESEREAGARREAEQRLDGARSAAEFLVESAEALRQLMADDYRLVRQAEAQRIAARLGAREPVAMDPLTGRVQDILDGLMRTPLRAFTDGRADLLAQVGQAIGEGQMAVPPTLSCDEAEKWLDKPETTTAIHDLAGQPLEADAMRLPGQFLSTMRVVEMAGLLSDLGLGDDQARATAEGLASASSQLRAAAAKRDEIAGAAPDVLAVVREALTQGQAIPPEAADAAQKLLAQADEVEANLTDAMVKNIEGLRRLLGPGQRGVVYWRPEGAVLRAIPREDRAADLKREAALVADGLDFINSVKFQSAKRYGNVKVQFTEDFVAQYVDPNGPFYERAREAALDVVRQARMVSTDDWDNGAGADYAGQLMQAVGALEQQVLPAQRNERYLWADLYELLTDNRVVTTARGWLTGGQQ